MEKVSTVAERWRHLLAVASDAMVVRQLDGSIVATNDAMAKLLGYSIDELEFMHIREVLSPASFSLVMGRQQHLLKGETTTQRYELTFLRKGGELKKCECVVRLIAEYDEPKRILASVRDVTEQRRTEEQLREKEQIYRRTLDSMLEGCMIVDFNWRYLYVNDAAARYDSSIKKRLLERTMMEEYPELEGSKVMDVFRFSMEERIPKRVETKFYLEDSTELWWEMNVQPVPEGICIHSLDITERKRRQRDMQFYIKEITRAQEEERKRIGRELHDEVAQRLATLSLGIDTVIRDGQELPPRIISTLRHVRKDADHLSEEVSRLSHALRPAMLDQLGLIPAVEYLVGDLVKKGKIEAQLEVIGEEQRLLPEVELGLYRIIQEAVNNARRHSGAANLTVTFKFHSDKVRIILKDDGKGFDARRWRRKSTDTGKLGLIGMEERAHLLNGTLSIESKLGEGTTVTVGVGRRALAAAE